MLQESKGYYTLDAFLGLSILIFVLAVIIPILNTIYTERISIKQERYALEILHNNLQNWLSGEEVADQDIASKDTVYSLKWKDSGNSIELCISWQASNTRNNKLCGQAK